MSSAPHATAQQLVDALAFDDVAGLHEVLAADVECLVAMSRHGGGSHRGRSRTMRAVRAAAGERPERLLGCRVDEHDGLATVTGPDLRLLLWVDGGRVARIVVGGPVAAERPVPATA